MYSHPPLLTQFVAMDQQVDRYSSPSRSNRNAITKVPTEIWCEILKDATSYSLKQQEISTVFDVDARNPRLISCPYICQYRRSEEVRCRLSLVCHLWSYILSKTQDQLVVFLPDYYWPPIRNWERVRYVCFAPQVLFCKNCSKLCKNCYTGLSPDLEQTMGILYPHAYKDSRSTTELKPNTRPLPANGSEGHLTPVKESLFELFGSFPISLPSLETFAFLRPCRSFETGLDAASQILSSEVGKLTSLSLQTSYLRPFLYPGGLNLPRLHSLRLIFYYPNRIGYNIGVGSWNLPSLSSLTIQGGLWTYNEQEFRVFIKQFAKSLTCLMFAILKRQGVSAYAAHIPSEMWEDLPTLRYLRAKTTALQSLDAIPKNHPPISIILEDFRTLSHNSEWKFPDSFIDHKRLIGLPIQSFTLPHSWEEFNRIITSVRETDSKLAANFSAAVSELRATRIPLVDRHGSPVESAEGRRNLGL